MLKSTWTDTQIYRALTERDSPYAKAMKNLLERPTAMPAIELILDLGGTTPKDFTLHNSGHSFRVAERMWELIPDGTKKILSEYELGMLLLSAYLHDIGMSPEYEKVQSLRVFLTERKEGLSESEIKDFQEWIDDDPRTGDLDIKTQFITEGCQINYILSYYIRHKHNSWSGSWMRKHLGNEQLVHYPDWVNDLILLCESHHKGLDHLVEEIFDPRPVDSHIRLHLRYLAICLRVADIMENDPDRTPEVLLSHRQINPESLKFWLKDHPFQLLRYENTYTVYARPSRAFIHKAVEETAMQIENELKLCDELIRRKPLSYSPSMTVEGYTWSIVPFVKRDIQPDKKAYEYIEGGFRPDTAKLLELLGGHQLYGNSLWAFRELLQNAFDAIKEQIAWGMINKNLDPKEHLEQLGKMLAIDISLAIKKDGAWLICRDQGVGMTKDIIEHYFLHSGASKRHEIKELERECLKRGFCLGRTGQFGIGVLSYFMLADKLVISTRRETGTGYPPEECIGWRFEINGTHDFGELAKADISLSGTEIQLKLNEQIAAEIAEWDTKFHSFLKENIQRAPCVMRYDSFISGSNKIGPGWTNTDQDIKSRIQKQFEKELYEKELEQLKIEEHKLPFKTRDARKERLSQIREAMVEMVQKMKFLVESGEINESIKYRIYIPYFNLMNGNSFFFLSETLRDGVHYINQVANGYWWCPQLMPAFSLKGVRTFFSGSSDRNERLSYAHIEVDIMEIDDSKLSVSREKVQIDEKHIQQMRHFIETRISSLIESNCNMLGKHYDTLNCVRTNNVPREFYWAFADRGTGHSLGVIWRRIEYPTYTPDDAEYAFGDMLLDDKKINCLETNLPAFAPRNYEGFMYLFQEFEFKFECDLGLMPGYSFGYRPYLIMLKEPFISPHLVYNEIDLPLLWSKILLIGSDNFQDAINRNHPLYKYYEPELLSRFYDGWEEKTPLEDRVWPDLGSKFECLGFLLFALSFDYKHVWNVTCDYNPSIAKGILSSLELGEVLKLDYDGLTVFSFGRSDIFRDPEEIEKFLPRIKDQKYLLQKV